MFVVAFDYHPHNLSDIKRKLFFFCKKNIEVYSNIIKVDQFYETILIINFSLTIMIIGASNLMETSGKYIGKFLFFHIRKL